MPTTELEEEVEQEATSENQQEATPQELQAAEKVRALYKGVRLRRKKTLASSKQLSYTQKKTAADAIGTDASRLSMSKRLFEAKEPKVKAFRAADAAITAWFKDPNHTLPDAEPGMRRVKKGKTLLDDEHEIAESTKTEAGPWEVKYRVMIDGKPRIRRVVIDQDEYKSRVRSSFQRFKAEGLRLIELAKRAAQELAADMPQIIERQRASLKKTFNAADYAFDPDECGWEISFPCMEPDPELAELDPETFREERERTIQASVQAARLEKQRMIETLVGWLDGLAAALSKRELLDREHEVVSKKILADGSVEVEYRDADRKKQTVTLTANDARQRLSVDDNPRKFNDATASRLFGAIAEAKQRKAELGISSPELDAALGQVERMVRNENAETLPDALREDDTYRGQVEQRCVAIAATLFESAELAPRRAILRRQMSHQALKKE